MFARPGKRQPSMYGERRPLGETGGTSGGARGDAGETRGSPGGTRRELGAARGELGGARGEPGGAQKERAPGRGNPVSSSSSSSSVSSQTPSLVSRLDLSGTHSVLLASSTPQGGGGSSATMSPPQKYTPTRSPPPNRTGLVSKVRPKIVPLVRKKSETPALVKKTLPFRTSPPDAHSLSSSDATTSPRQTPVPRSAPLPRKDTATGHRETTSLWKETGRAELPTIPREQRASRTKASLHRLGNKMPSPQPMPLDERQRHDRVQHFVPEPRAPTPVHTVHSECLSVCVHA